MTYILGLSAYYHDSSAALIKDGEIMCAVQEERFTRIKHDNNFPSECIKYILKNFKIKLSDIEFITFYEKPFLKFERLIETYVATAPYAFSSFSKAIPIWLKEKLFLKNVIKERLQEFDNEFSEKKIKFAEHHVSHAASAFYPSPFKEAIILTIDGVGEWASTSVAVGKNNSIEIKKEIHFPHSLGLLYSAFTYYLGFKVNSGEYKIMGLAPYGVPRFKNLILEKIIDLKSDGSFRLDQTYFNYSTGLTMTNKKFSNLFGKKVRLVQEKLEQFHMDVASSVQAVTEEVMIKITKNLSEEYKIENLCLAGGVALNCVSNGKILQKNFFEKVWVQPAAGDAGGSIGSALAYWHQELKKERIVNPEDSMKGSYLGSEYSDSDIEIQLIKMNAVFLKLKYEEILVKTAKVLSENKSVGWFQGKMEYGPRSLGNRAIIADPRSSNTQKDLNLKIKFRESFRPFAPAILYEDLKDWFDISSKSPYMLFVCNVLDRLKISESEEEKKLFGIDRLNAKRSKIPAVTHVDYSARIQTVHKNTNPKFHSLISEFKKLTGCPILVNTSFNIRGEPIVESPLDAYKCFMGTNLDYCVLGNYFLSKKEQKNFTNNDYRKSFEMD
jgi:carbamoyltransferase